MMYDWGEIYKLVFNMSAVICGIWKWKSVFQ